MKKKLIIVISIIAIALIALFFLVKGGSSRDVRLMKGYTEIMDIPGASFYMKESILDKATAVTQISDDVGIDGKNYYVYKNGEDTFILFNLQSVVVVLEKNTGFHFSESKKKEDSLKNNSVCNIWFDKSGKKLQQEHSSGWYLSTVTAQVSITKTLFGNFCGKLCTIEGSDGIEWSLFCGVPGEDFDELIDSDKDAIDYIARSFRLTPDVDVTDVPVIDNHDSALDNEADAVVAETEMAIEPEEQTQKEEDSIPVGQMEASPENTDTSDQDPAQVTDSIIPVTEIIEPIIEEKTSNSEDLSLEASMNNPVADSTDESVMKENVTEFKSSLETFKNYMGRKKADKKTSEEKPINADKNDDMSTSFVEIGFNQKSVTDNSDEVYFSTIYSMLSVGQKGYMDVVTGKSEVEMPIIRIKKVLKGTDAEKYIKEKMDAREYFPPAEGTSYHVALYDVDYMDCKTNPYINIKIRGVDGDILKYRGIKYSKKTHDIASDVHQDGSWRTGYICFYEVPNGCSEYVLECGDGSIQNNLHAAYYHISQ